MKNILCVIPARLRSTRLSEKLLMPIAGKPLLYYAWRQAKKAACLREVVIATDSIKIQRAAISFGAKTVMTGPCPTGTDRVAQAARAFKEFTPQIVVNVQGDEPLMPPEAIDACVKALIDDTAVSMATIASPMPSSFTSVDSVVKVVCDNAGRALYFSRSPIPFPRNACEGYLRHIGLYAFRAPFLMKYVDLPQTPLEITEGLEQLRALEHGYAIRVAQGDFTSIGVDVMADFISVKKELLSHVRH